MSRQLPLAGRVAIVTGAGNGIGAATVRKLAGDGAKVVINDLDPASAVALAEAIAAEGGEALAWPGDVTGEQFADGCIAAALEHFGGLHILVNNAGYARHGMVQNTGDDLWEAMLDIHLTAPFRLIRAAAPHFRAEYQREAEAGTVRHRKIVNVSSGSISGVPGHAGYAAGKAGLLGLTNTVAAELGRCAVNVNAVAFGLIETRINAPLQSGEVRRTQIGGAPVEMGLPPDRFARIAAGNMLGRAGTPEEAAGAIHFLCSPESDYITAQCLMVDGG